MNNVIKTVLELTVFGVLVGGLMIYAVYSALGSPF